MIPELVPRARRHGAALLLGAFAALAQGCVSTEALYAEYDERACRVTVESAAGGATRVREPGTERTMLWEPLINFALDDATLDAGGTRRLDRDVAVLLAYPELRVSVRGFTDARGRASHNRELARRRVESVASYLHERGVDRARIDEVPVGEGVPLVRRSGEESVPADRRIELLLTVADGRPVPLHLRPAAAGDADDVDVPSGDEGESGDDGSGGTDDVDGGR